MQFTYTDTVYNRGAVGGGVGEKVKEQSERFKNMTGGTTGFNTSLILFTVVNLEH